jgi:hypothetical protein
VAAEPGHDRLELRAQGSGLHPAGRDAHAARDVLLLPDDAGDKGPEGHAAPRVACDS